jgi:hypothetical protein
MYDEHLRPISFGLICNTANLQLASSKSDCCTANQFVRLSTQQINMVEIETDLLHGFNKQPMVAFCTGRVTFGSTFRSVNITTDSAAR